MILVYVDDLLITGDNESMIAEAKEALHQQFNLKELGELKYFLETGLAGTKKANTPLESNSKLTSVEIDEAAGVTNDVVLNDVTAYQRLVGKLMYATITRPDISYAVQTLSQFMKMPKKSHLEVAHRVVRYLKGSVGQGIWMKPQGITDLICWCDFDWAACPNTRRSVTSYVIQLGGSLVS
ncbi:uncharacterized mitochondrial protein AtMg00810-like [Capsicum annuum]|uniref:uncharacterized mitochondrial protein AtMg00810-like n=1 Tax=Capsicum annuum TaxID=4072 RepID=UPI001FB0785E|nr:uncharacterized mitochondrial protein AtMg00810-like [Capsicum annuum]